MTEILIQYPNGGKVEVHPMVDRFAADFQKIVACCDYFAKQGKRTLITPRFSETVTNPDYVLIYAFLKDTPYWGKCPDFCVEGVWYEHEGFDKNKDLSDRRKRADTFSEMMTRGVRQSDRIVVEDCGAGRYYSKRNIYNRIHFEQQNISEVYIRTSLGLEVLYKKEED